MRDIKPFHFPVSNRAATAAWLDLAQTVSPLECKGLRSISSYTAAFVATSSERHVTNSMQRDGKVSRLVSKDVLAAIFEFLRIQPKTSR